MIEKAPRKAGKICRYMPWRPNLEKDDKIRLVNDASAKPKGGPSLNDLIHVGPKLHKNLVGLLISFRLRAIALTADIEKAFLQMMLDEKDRDSVRILSLKNFTQPVSPSNIEIYRSTRPPFGVNASPFLLNMVIQDLFSDEPENQWYKIGRESFYVDNLLVSTTTVVEALQLYEVLTEKLKSVGFNLREWTSNSVQFRKSIPAEKLSTKAHVSVSGLSWDVNLDTLSYKFEDKVEAHSLRTTLSCLQQVFDPLGCILPCLLDLKMFLQECWKLKLSWDQELPTPFQARLQRLKVERNEILGITMPRFLWPQPMNGAGSLFELHTFCDASIKAYGCAVYLVSKPKSGCLVRTYSLRKVGWHP